MGATLGRLLFAAALVLGFAWALDQRPPAATVANACGAAGPFDFDTFEVENYLQGYAAAIVLATEGKAIASTFTVGSETVDVRYQGLKAGTRQSRQNEATSRRIPPSIYKSIAWVESNWANGASSVPYGGVGPILRSFDCGYGLGQVTSGMTNNTGTASAKQAAIGTHYLANISEGVRILADKWNSAPRFRPIAGNGDPAVIEDWYYAIWSYNGFAFSNHPLNPMRDPLRGGSAVSPIYHCQDPSAPSYQAQGGSVKFGYGDYTYPERVYGCMQYPPIVTPPGSATSTRLYTKQDVTMPDFRITRIAQAFNTAHFTSCENAGFNGGCPDMDFPTAIEQVDPPPTPGTGTPVNYTAVAGDNCQTIADAQHITVPQLLALNPSINAACSNLAVGQVVVIKLGAPSTPVPGPPKVMVPHVDQTPPADPALAAVLLGQPLLVYSGSATATFTVEPNGLVNTVTVQVANAGTGIGAFRVHASQPWLVARHATDASTRTIDGGVAIGAETQVVIQSPRASPLRSRIAQNGYLSVLSITVLPDLMEPGASTAKLWIEPILSSGAVFELSVTATRPAVIGTQVPATNTPTATATATHAASVSASVSPTSTPLPPRARRTRTRSARSPPGSVRTIDCARPLAPGLREAIGANILPTRVGGGSSMDDAWLIERTIAELQAAMAAGTHSSAELTRAYIDRIVRLDRGPGGFRSVIEVNPDALTIARSLDRERRVRGARGPLHGIPILLKDNIDTGDRMLTTAGSFALASSRPPGDSAVARRLRAAGAVLLGKANMSEWANFRSSASISGWSARGGQCRNAYAAGHNPSGSSSGSAVATAANLCAAAIGSETDGSIISPANVNGVVGIKPTVGLVSRAGIIPISASQDTAGPMARTVADAATLLDAIAGPDHRDPATRAVRRPRDGYVSALSAGGLRGARIGVARDVYTGYHEGTDAVFEAAVSALSAAGATIVDPADIPTARQMKEDTFGELHILEYEFKRDIATYLATRLPKPGFKAMRIPRTLADLIAFNDANKQLELSVFGQEIFEFSEKLAITEAEYRATLARNLRLAGRDGIDAVLAAHNLDALVAPAGAPAREIGPDKFDGGCTSPAAMAGYPMVSVPAGYVNGLPVGLAFIGAAWSEPTLIRLAHGFEQATRHRRPPA